MVINQLDIKSYRERYGISQEEFAKMIGSSARTVQNYEAGGVIPKSKHEILRMILSAKPRDLIVTNKKESAAITNMTVQDPAEQLTNKTGNVFEELPNGKYKIWTKRVPVKAFASYLSEFRNANFVEELEDVPWIVDHFARGRYMTFEAEGNSMWNEGGYDAPDGADLLGRELQKHHWKDGFRESVYGWVIVHRETMVYKDITEYNNATGDIVCHSRSGLPNHPDFTINLNDVIEIWKVIKRSF